MITIDGIEGHLIPGDVSYLADVCKTLPAWPVIAEIGSWKGLTATIMARARGDATIHCIDTWTGSVEHVKDPSILAGTLYKEFSENVEPLGDQIHAWAMKSEEAAPYMFANELDLLLIDGDHSKEGCLNDLRVWSKKVKPGGVILVHDCNDPGVKAAMAEFGKTYTLTEPPLAHYMGRIQWGI